MVESASSFPSTTIAAAVSSQEVSMPRIVILSDFLIFTLFLFQVINSLCLKEYITAFGLLISHSRA